MNFAIVGERSSAVQQWLADGLRAELERRGNVYEETPSRDVRLVLNFTDMEHPRPYRRRARATFVCSVVMGQEPPKDVLRAGYPVLIRSLSNLLLFAVPQDGKVDTHFVTLEQGYYTVPFDADERSYFARLYERLHPLASSNLVIDNVFEPDLPPELWEGDAAVDQIRRTSRRLGELDLLPAPFPIQEILPPEDFRHVQHLYGIGGLSYGNISARRDRHSFWMSASGVNKYKLEKVGQDILLVKGYDAEKNAIVLSVPPNVTPRRVSVDAIEHWMIYTEHPQVGAILHVHAWMDGIKSTLVNFPCGTLELAQSVANLVREAPDPGRAVIGLRNHGLTITGPDLDEIFERIDGRLIRQVPMM
ncbi:MAG: class II aldolase/adducin family protein [Limnochordaceae bacterium]|nr:class II aldolase/adducin family protein [Limnochordaceae bacterium]